MSKKHSLIKSPPAAHVSPPPAPINNRQEIEQTEPEKLGFERLVFFSDAVFAIAITLLVLEIHLPAEAGTMGNTELLKALLALFPQYLAYMISFLVIGSMWITHHRKFRLIQRLNRRVIFINLLFLMTIAFIPFPTLVLSESGNRTATIFYALTIIAAAIFSLWLSLYANIHRSELAPQTDAAQMRRQVWQGLITPSIFLLSIGVAFINENLARFTWFLILPLLIFLRRAD
jgi:uncharacterized membrane protein